MQAKNQVVASVGRPDLIPSEQVARVHLAGNVGQLVASTVGHDEIAALLERSQVANDLAAEEVGGVERRLVHDHAHAFTFTRFMIPCTEEARKLSEPVFVVRR